MTICGGLMGLGKGVADMAAELGALPAEGLAGLDYILACLNANEHGDGALYAALHRGRFVFNKSSGEWLAWAGHHWRRDVMGEHLAAVEDVAERYLEELGPLDELIGEATRDGKKEYAKELEATRRTIERRASRLRSESGRQNAVKFANTSREALAIVGEELDANPWLLACANGVIDLQTGKMRPGRQKDYLLKAVPVAWDGLDAPAPVWERTLLEIFDGDAELVAYLQRLFGYGVTGLSTEHVLPVLHGKGRNGKSLIVETIHAVLGDLAGPIQSEMLLDQGRSKSSSGPSPDIMSLRGLRLAFASETDEHRKFSPSRCKWLSGSDTLVGRYPHDKYESKFRPTHMLVLLTNHRPHAPADDFAFWERVHLVPFPLSFVDREPEEADERRMDKSLPAQLRAEASGVLAWLVRGCLAWQSEGLRPPPAVLEATGAYKREEDLLADFLEEVCLADPGVVPAGEELSAALLYEAFRTWFETNVSKKHVWTQKVFGLAMAKRFAKRKRNGLIYYLGLRLKEG